jgi:hypothetical protein
MGDGTRLWSSQSRAALHRFVGFYRTIQKNFVRGKSF